MSARVFICVYITHCSKKMKVLLFALFILQVIDSLARVAIPHGLKHNLQIIRPNSLNLLGRTQEYVDGLDEDVKDYLRFLEKHKKRVVFKKELQNENNTFYDINVEKIVKLGNISFGPPTIPHKTIQIDFDEYKKVTHGMYLRCSMMETFYVPKPLHLNENASSIFSIEPLEFEEHYFDKTLIAITGKTFVGCNFPAVFVPSKQLLPGEKNEIVSKLKKESLF